MEKQYSDELQQMREEMDSLKSLLNEQQIVNERLIRKAMAADYNKERKEMWHTIVIAVLVSPIYAVVFPKIGMPLWFTIVTYIFFIGAIAGTYYSKLRYVSQNVMTADPLTVASNMAAYKRFGNNWLKISIPFLCLWFFILFHYAGRLMEHEAYVGFCCGGITGGIVGGAIGLWRLYVSRQRIKNILSHIEELKK